MRARTSVLSVIRPGGLDAVHHRHPHVHRSRRRPGSAAASTASAPLPCLAGPRRTMVAAGGPARTPPAPGPGRRRPPPAARRPSGYARHWAQAGGRGMCALTWNPVTGPRCRAELTAQQGRTRSRIPMMPCPPPPKARTDPPSPPPVPPGPAPVPSSGGSSARNQLGADPAAVVEQSLAAGGASATRGPDRRSLRGAMPGASQFGQAHAVVCHLDDQLVVVTDQHLARGWSCARA